MSDLLLQIDKTLFTFFNQTLTNPVFDMIMPRITDLNKEWYGWVLFIGLYLLLVLKGGKKGRILGVAFLVVVGFSDQLSSTFIKKMIMRPRPCHEIDGRVIMEHLRLLVPCGSGYSFPSSHAVNMFGAATFFSVYYRKYGWAFYTFAVVVAYSRVYVGVHYPYDVVVGALIGSLCALIIVYILELAGKYFPAIAIKELPE